VTCGVPQGGVLAALLFTLYINDLGFIKLNGDIRLYADDTAIIYDQYDAKLIQEDLHMIHDWFRINKLSINENKTKYMIFKSINRTTSLDPQQLQLNERQIEKVKSIKHLGLYIDECLTWTEQIDKLSKEVSRAVGIMFKLKYKMQRHVLKNLYFSLIHSKLCYMVSIWGSAKEIHKKQLYTLQNRALKILFGLPVLYSTELLFGTVAQNILNIEKIYQKSLVTFTHQCLHNYVHHNVKYEKTISRTRAGKRETLKLPSVKTTRYGLESIKYRSIIFYNQLPPILINTMSFTVFKNQLKKFLMNNTIKNTLN